MRKQKPELSNVCSIIIYIPYQNQSNEILNLILIQKMRVDARSSTLIFYILSININTAACCSSVNLDQLSRSFFWLSVRETVFSSSANNCESVIPKAIQIFSSEGTVGTIFLRYHEEMVD